MFSQCLIDIKSLENSLLVIIRLSIFVYEIRGIQILLFQSLQHFEKEEEIQWEEKEMQS